MGFWAIGRLQTIDVSDPTAPRSVSTRTIPAQPESSFVDWISVGGQLAVAGRDVYIEGNWTGLWVFGAGTLPGRTETFEGLYWANFEHTQFAPKPDGCPKDEDWWYLLLVRGSDFEQRYRAIYPTYDLPMPGRSGYVRVRFEGHVSPPSPAAYTWFRDRAVTVTKVLDMGAVSACGSAPRATIWLPWLATPPSNVISSEPSSVVR